MHHVVWASKNKNTDSFPNIEQFSSINPSMTDWGVDNVACTKRSLIYNDISELIYQFKFKVLFILIRISLNFGKYSIVNDYT